MKSIEFIFFSNVYSVITSIKMNKTVQVFKNNIESYRKELNDLKKAFQNKQRNDEEERQDELQKALFESESEASR